MSSIQIYTSRGNTYVRIVESYRDPITKKPKTRVLENLGRADVLEAENPGIIQRLKDEHSKTRALGKKIKEEKIINKIKDVIENKPSESEGFPIKNYGFYTYRNIWKELNLDSFFLRHQKNDSNIRFSTNDVISMLTYSRLLFPDSKRNTFLNQDKFFDIPSCKLENIYRSLKFLSDQKNNLELHLNKQISKLTNRNIAVAFYDVTTYYFESVKVDDIKKFGYSKDNKVNQVQVVMGLLIDDNGIPISYELFPGNTNDFKTLEPIMTDLKNRYGIHKVIITADRGLNSKSNLHFLKSIGYDYVMAYKIRSSSHQIKELVLNTQDYMDSGNGFKWKECEFENTISVNGKKKTLNDRMILTWSAKRASKDKKDRDRLVEKAKRLVEGKSQFKAEMKKGGKKYVKTILGEESSIAFDDEQVRIDEQFDGYYGIETSDTNLTPMEVVDVYHGLWKIEESFRVLKSNLEARPIYVWTEESIRGHFALCYLALVLQRVLEYKLRQKHDEISSERIQDALRSANMTVLEEDGQKYFIKNKANEDFIKILNTLKEKNIEAYGKIK